MTLAMHEHRGNFLVSAVKNPEGYMEKLDPDVYSRRKA